MDDRVGDILAQRARLENGAGVAIFFSVLFHATLTAIAGWSAWHLASAQATPVMMIRFAQTQPAPEVTSGAPPPPAAHAAEGSGAPPKPVDKKKTAPPSPFGRSTKKAAEPTPPPPPPPPQPPPPPPPANPPPPPRAGRG